MIDNSALAFSIDGRAFEFRAPMDVPFDVGGYVRLETPEGRAFLGQIVTDEVVSLEGPTILPDSDVSADDPLDEIRGLVKSAGLVVVGSMLQKRPEIDVATYIGSGKVQELKELVEAHEADLVVFDNDLARPRRGTWSASWASR